jgi:prepilin-type N-terminal cleavage/methylation domain-containing protein
LPKCRAHGVSGYTLVELLTALSVLALVAAIGYPQLAAYNIQYKLSAAANQLAFELARARMKAIGENVYTKMTFGTVVSNQFGYGTGYQLSKSDDGVTYTAVMGQGGPTRLPSGVTVYAFPGQVTFTRQGLASSAVTLWLVNENSQWKLVTMNSVGKVRVQ